MPLTIAMLITMVSPMRTIATIATTAQAQCGLATTHRTAQNCQPAMCYLTKPTKEDTTMMNTFLTILVILHHTSYLSHSNNPLSNQRKFTLMTTSSAITLLSEVKPAFRNSFHQ